MRAIKNVARDIEGNIREAREKIAKAYQMMESNRPYADWQRDMAMGHLAFNAKGHEIVKKMIADIAGSTDPLAPGMRAMFEDIHADMMRDTAEVKAMIDSYGK